MTIQPDYVYGPIYGIDPYVPNGVPQNTMLGGGADFTKNNLIISMWGNIAFDGVVDQPTDGDLLKPVTAFGDWFDLVPIVGAFQPFVGLATEGFKPQFDSRYAAKFHIDPFLKASVAPPYMAVMNPPPALKQRLVDAITSVLASATPIGWQATIAKSLLDAYLWSVRYEGSSSVLGISRETSTPSGGTTAYGSAMGHVGLCKTNGADGVFPEFYAPLQVTDVVPVAQLQELLDGLNSGAFYTPIVLIPNDTAVDITIEYPHSIARG